MSKIKAFMVSALLMLAFGLFGQDFSNTFHENYPIFGFTQIGYSCNPAANVFFDINNLNSISNDQGSVIASLENKSVKNGVCTVTLLLVVDGNKTARIQFSIQSDEFSEINYLTLMKVAVLSSGETQSVQYDGYSQNSLGQVLGGFSTLFSTFYNTEKIFPN